MYDQDTQNFTRKREREFEKKHAEKEKKEEIGEDKSTILSAFYTLNRMRN